MLLHREAHGEDAANENRLNNIYRIKRHIAQHRLSYTMHRWTYAFCELLRLGVTEQLGLSWGAAARPKGLDDMYDT